MPSVYDVAKYILAQTGDIPATKLHKLLYYSQAWSLVWDEKPLFNERVEAWVNGPVVRALYASHRLEYMIGPHHPLCQVGNVDILSKEQKDTIDSVVKFYGKQTAQWLSDLTHSEAPWQQAREGLATSDRSEREITHASMAEYFGSLPAQ